MKCLLVEPSATLRRALGNALRRAGVPEVVIATDGLQAVALADSSFDLVVTEWTLPSLSGLELIKRLRANPDTSEVSLLMLTSRAGKEDVLEALQAGVNGYLLKPFTGDGLRQSLETLIAIGHDEEQAEDEEDKSKAA